MALYKFEKFKSKQEGSDLDLSILVSKSNRISKAIKNSEIISDGVIFTNPVPNFGLTYVSAIIGTFRPVKGTETFLPINFFRQFLGVLFIILE